MNELKFCQLSDWDCKKTYDESYIHYTIEWKITVNNRAIMPKDIEQDIVLAPTAHWQHVLRPKLEDSVTALVPTPAPGGHMIAPSI
jgi:hypothetical protein